MEPDAPPDAQADLSLTAARVIGPAKARDGVTGVAPLSLMFASRARRPGPFTLTQALVTEAQARAGVSEIECTVPGAVPTPEQLARIDGLVTSNDILRDPAFPLHDLAAAAPRLRWIQVTSAGIEPLLPLDWLHPGLVLTNNSGVHAAKTREAGMMALLMLNARMPALATQQRHGQWRQIFTPAIAGRSVLVIGLGAIGGAVAAAARTLGMKVVGVRRQAGHSPHADRVIGMDALDDALPEADFVVLATPLTPDTRLLLDRRRIRLMKPGAGLLNIGRGPCLDYAALEDALGTGALSGAILDVFDTEPLPPHAMTWSTPNLVVTPHVIVDDVDQYVPLSLDFAFANATRLQRGEALANVVDPARGY